MQFKGKHEILLQNPDGSRTPMDEPWFQSRKIDAGTWQILSAGDYTYLLEGSSEALVIDTGYGAGNLREFCQSLTGTSVRYAANTHEHLDHTLNNYQFETVFMSSACAEGLAVKGRGEFADVEIPADYEKRILTDGDTIDLPGRKLTAIAIPNHAKGSLAYLDKAHRILFSGDELMAHTRLNISVEAFLANMEKLMRVRHEYDLLCAGSGLMDPIFVDRFYHTAQLILEREAKGLEPLGSPAIPCYFPAPFTDEEGRTVFPSRRLPRRFGPMEPKEAEYKRTLEYADCLITYDIRKIREETCCGNRQL